MVNEKLLKKTESLCPRCMEKIPARLVDREGKVIIKKNCPEHGDFEDIYWGNTEGYNRVMRYLHEGTSIENPRTKRDKGCPYDCGLCNEHKSHTILGIIDVTNRCNLNCPICFANANSTGLVYEPSLEQIRKMLENLRKNRPIKSFAFQFSGGEPTIRNDLPEMIKIAKEMGFSYIMVDTNGIKIAEDRKYIKVLHEAGLNSFYLQFDGLDDDVYELTRGMPMLKTKLQAIENCRKLGLRNIVLVVTLIKGINDKQIGGIIKFAIENSDVITCVNFQPISFAGKASSMEVKKNRITTNEFMELVEKQTKGRIKKEYFYPIPAMVPASDFIEAYKGRDIPKLSTHPCCGIGTYVIINENNSYMPINEIVNVDKFFDILKMGSKELKKNRGISLKLSNIRLKARLLSEVLKSVRDSKRRDLIGRIIKNATVKDTINFHKNAVMIGCMHFMDSWNFDMDRVCRCVIHYALPDGRLVPFCSYNTIHRAELERKYSVP